MERYKWNVVEFSADCASLECNGQNIILGNYDALDQLAAAHNAALEQSHAMVDELDGVSN